VLTAHRGTTFRPAAASGLLRRKTARVTHLKAVSGSRGLVDIARRKFKLAYGNPRI